MNTKGYDLFWEALKMQVTTWSFSRIILFVECGIACLACAAAGILAATAISFAVPVHFQSQAAVMVTPADEASDFLVGGKVAKIALSSESLASIIREDNLYQRERAAMSLDDVIGKMRGKICVIPLPAGLPGNRYARTFIIQFDYPDAHVAQQVDSEVISRFRESAVATTAPLHDSRLIFLVLDPPNLPQSPAGLDRTQFAAVGLLAGILCGITLAIAVRKRRIEPVRLALM